MNLNNSCRRILNIQKQIFLNYRRKRAVSAGNRCEAQQLVEAADAIIISTPEYNLSYTAVLKNALEWLSRRTLQTPLAEKPVALIGAASIQVGVSHSHLRDVIYGLNMRLINRPIIQVGNAREKFDEKGNLIDTGVKELLGKLKDELIGTIQHKK